MKQVVLAGAVRTALGDFGGALKGVPAADMAQLVMEKVCGESKLQTAIGKVIFGNCFAPLDQNIARVAAYRAGIPHLVPAFTVNATCGSSMQAIISAVQAVRCGETEVILAGGVESMSNAPYIMDATRWGQRMRHAQAYDLLWKGMQEHPIGVGMGLTAENVAEKYDISRREQDEFAVLSHRRASKAIDEGRFTSEILPVRVSRPKKEPLIFETDEHVRRDVTLEQLERLPAAFKKDGTVTAGNACGMNDAAAAVLVTTMDKAREMGLDPVVRVKVYRVVGVDPNIMGIGPVPAIRKELDQDDEELTATMKVKRSNIEKKFKDLIESMY